MKFCLLTSLFLLYGGLSLAQNRTRIDSLYQATKSNISDKKKVDIYIEIAEEYRSSDSSKTYQYANQAIRLAQKTKYPKGRIDALYEIGRLNFALVKYKEAEDVFRQIIQESEKNSYPKGKAKALNALGLIYNRQGKYDKALGYYFKALKIFKKTEHKGSIADVYANLGTVGGMQGKYDKALGYYFKALKIFEKIKNQVGTANTYNNLGLIQDIQGKYDKALEYHFKALKVRKKIDDKKGVATTFNNLGIVYRKQDNYEEALEYYLKALEINREIKYKLGIANNCGNIGIIYGKQTNYEQALKYYHEALDTFKALDSKTGIATCFDNIGTVYTAQEDYEKALTYILNALAIYEEIGAKGKKTSPLLSLGKIYFEQKKWALSKKYLNECLDLSQEVGFIENIKDSAEKLSLVEKELGNYRTAYEYQVLFKKTADSLLNEEQIKKITQLEDKHVFQQEKDSIQFANKAQKEILEKDIEKRKITQITTFISLGLALALIIVLIFFFRNQRLYNQKLKSKNQKVKIQNEELSAMNEKLLDSEAQQKKLNNVKNKLFSIISHDLREPLGSISSFLDLFINYRVLNEEESLKIASGLVTSVKYTSFLLDNLLHWAKTQMDKHSLEATEVAMKDIVINNINLFQNIAKNKSIRLLQGKTEDTIVWADSNMLDFTVRNLLSNAIKFTPKGGEIEISYQRKEELLQVEVRDSGVGISPDVIEKLFSETAHVSTFGTSKEKGVGLGLKLCKDFVNQNGGKIWVESELGKGTSFYFTVPYCK